MNFIKKIYTTYKKIMRFVKIIKMLLRENRKNIFFDKNGNQIKNPLLFKK